MTKNNVFKKVEAQVCMMYNSIMNKLMTDANRKQAAKNFLENIEASGLSTVGNGKIRSCYAIIPAWGESPYKFGKFSQPEAFNIIPLVSLDDSLLVEFWRRPGDYLQSFEGFLDNLIKFDGSFDAYQEMPKDQLWCEVSWSQDPWAFWASELRWYQAPETEKFVFMKNTSDVSTFISAFICFKNVEAMIRMRECLKKDVFYSNADHAPTSAMSLAGIKEWDMMAEFMVAQVIEFCNLSAWGAAERFVSEARGILNMTEILLGC